MTQLKHTPTPWAISHDNENTIVPVSSASVEWSAQTNHDNRFSKVDAAFIVKAVNNHEALIERLTMCQNILSAIMDSETKFDARAFLAKQMNINESVLAAAKGDA